LLKACAADGVGPLDMIEPAAVELLAKKLRTPLQIDQHLTRAFEESFKSGEKPVGVHAIEAVLSPQLDDLEPKLMRQGYDVRALADRFHSKRAERDHLTVLLDLFQRDQHHGRPELHLGRRVLPVRVFNGSIARADDLRYLITSAVRAVGADAPQQR
jgi:hypothetical protein